MKSKPRPNLLNASLALILTATLCLPACGSQSDNPQAVSDTTERYEQSLPLPDGVIRILDMRYTETGQLLMAATTSSVSSGASLYALTTGNVWEPQFDTQNLLAALGPDASVWTAGITPMGKLLCSIDSSDATDGSCFLVDPGAYEVVPLTAAGITDIRCFDDDTAVIADSTWSLYRVDLTTGEKRCEYRLRGNGRVLTDFTVQDGLVFATTSQSTGTDITSECEILDYDTGERSEPDAAVKDAAESLFPQSGSSKPASPVWAGNENRLYACAKNAIYEIGRNGAVSVASGSSTSLASTAKSPTRLIVGPGADDMVVLFQGLNGTSNPYTLYRYPQGSKPEITAALVVYSLENNASVQQAVETFRDKRPDVEIEVRIGASATTGLSTDDALRALNADIVAGTGPDIIVLDGLPVESFVGQGVLLDLSDVLENLRATGDGYFGNILGAFAQDDACYALPSRFSFPALLGDTEYLKHATSLEDLTNFVSTNDATRSGLDTAISIPALYSASYRTMFEGADVNRSELETFFTCSEALLAIGCDNMLAGADEELRANLESYDYLGSSIADLKADGRSMEGAGILLSDVQRHLEIGAVTDNVDFGKMSLAVLNAGFDCSFTPLSFTGERVFTPSSILAINANSDETELSKELITHFLSKQQQKQTPYGGGLPVSESAFREAVLELGGYGVSALSDTGPTKEFSRDGFTQQEADSFCAMIESASCALVSDSIVSGIVAEELTAYCRGTSTLDEAVENAVRKIDLYRAQ